MFPTPLQSLAEGYSCTRGLFLIGIASDQGDTKNTSVYLERELLEAAHNQLNEELY